MQIYKEQVYDLLNPTSLVMGGNEGGKGSGGGAGGPGTPKGGFGSGPTRKAGPNGQVGYTGALRMR